MKLRKARMFFAGLSLLLPLTSLSLALALDVPPLRQRINDYAGLIPPTERRRSKSVWPALNRKPAIRSQCLPFQVSKATPWRTLAFEWQRPGRSVKKDSTTAQSFSSPKKKVRFELKSGTASKAFFLTLLQAGSSEKL